MARVIGQAGRGAAVEAVFSAGEAVLLVLSLLLFVSIYAATPAFRWPALIAAFVIDAILFRKAIANVIRKLLGSRRWWRGFQGERRVGLELERLSNEYVVFHDYLYSRDGREWNVDHIVIGPTGVFVLETKNPYRGRIRSAKFDARTQKHVAQARRNAMTLKEQLEKWSGGQLNKVFVEGWVVYAQENAHVDELREGPTHVIPLRLLVNDIAGRPKQDIDWDAARRITRALFALMPAERQADYRAAFDVVQQDQKPRVAQHVEAAQAARKAKSVEQALPTVCPECGGSLVRRRAKSGPYAGKEFLGCSNWRTRHCCYKLDLDTMQEKTA